MSSKIYVPIQPLSHKSGIYYVQFVPHLQLQEYIYYYWQLKTTQVLPTPFVHNVVADGCMDIFFDVNQPSQSFVMGLASHHTQFVLPPDFHYIGVRFRPAAFPRLFRMQASELTNQDLHLSTVLKSTAQFIAETFQPPMLMSQINTHLDQYFLKQRQKNQELLDTRLANALHLIIQNRGILHIEKEIDVGVSNRQLRRLFQQYVGHSPKTFAKIVRFQHLLQLNHHNYLYNSKLFYDLGYYDQAHFIKEFKTLFGTTPTQAFSQ